MKFVNYSVFLAIRLFILANSSRLTINDTPPCRISDPTALRSDQMTVIINGYSEHRIPLIHSIAATYASAPSVAAVILLWCNPSTSPETLSNLTANLSATVLRSPSSSLNYRFYPWKTIKTKAVLICDDDIEPDPHSIAFAFSVWRSDPTRLIGFFARSHAYDVASRTWIYTMEKERYSIVLTKLMIVNINYLVRYSCDDRYSDARKIVEEINNCEDILMNFVVAEGIGRGPAMIGVKRGIRDFGDARNDDVSGGVKGVGLSSRKGAHRKRRGGCIMEFHRILEIMPLKYSYGKLVDHVGEQGLCEKGGKVVFCDQQNYRR